MHLKPADRRRRLFAPEGEGAAAAAASPDAAAAAAAAASAAPDAAAAAAAAAAAGAQPAAAAAQSSAKWWETLSDPHKAYLTPKGLAVDDPMQALPRLIDIAANAEKRIGKGLDSILDKPAKDQPYGEWARANAEALGLPKDEGGYEIKPPADWPKDIPWDSANEAKMRTIALQHGVPPAAHAAYIGAYAEIVKQIDADATRGLEEARTKMREDLQKDWGAQTEAKMTQARQAFQFLAEKAGLGTDGIQAASQALAAKTGDAGVLRLFAAVADLMSDDTGFAMARGQQTLGMTPAEARAELARFESPEGEYGKAYKAGDMRRMAELRAKRDQLSKLAAGG